MPCNHQVFSCAFLPAWHCLLAWWLWMTICVCAHCESVFALHTCAAHACPEGVCARPLLACASPGRASLACHRPAGELSSYCAQFPPPYTHICSHKGRVTHGIEDMLPMAEAATHSPPHTHTHVCLGPCHTWHRGHAAQDRGSH